ncbi:hypothetical protein HF313_01510 [Massilia atriviolacea]|uniref:hypothetical protein n=1 Tax=Massilia atriviolacea TaxID=2495579 RepID=UPI0013DFA176|nr:hypothetical protein [Massilia atriviolacea]
MSPSNAPEKHAQGHSPDKLQLFERLVSGEQECKEVIDNMNVVHAMYKGFTLKACAQA